jgi:hypothetical protein
VGDNVSNVTRHTSVTARTLDAAISEVEERAPFHQRSNLTVQWAGETGNSDGSVKFALTVTGPADVVDKVI